MTNITSASVRFQADQETIQRHLDEIQAAWTEQGIETPVLDEFGDIDADAEVELLDRLPINESEYRLMDADTATLIGPATKEQIQASLEAGETGTILIDDQGDVIPVSAARQGLPTPPSARRVYVEA